MLRSLSDDDVIDFQTFFELIVGDRGADLIDSFLDVALGLSCMKFEVVISP